MKKKSSLIFKKLEAHLPNETGIFDQGYLNDVCWDDFEVLPLEYNWKPYWGTNDNAIIVHFHGLKPGGDDVLSGFATSNSMYVLLFIEQLSNIVGYILYLKTFFYYYNQNQDKWITEHVTNILSNTEKESFKNNYRFIRKLKKRLVLANLLNILTFFLSKKLRKQINLLKNDIKNFSPKIM